MDNSGILQVMSRPLWKEVLAVVEPSISRPNFVTWLKPTELIDMENGLARISVKNPYAKTWLEANACKKLLTALQKHHPDVEQIELVIAESDSTSEGELPLFAESIESTPEEPTAEAREKAKKQSSQFNSRYSFDSFIVGNNNRLAFAAASAVAEKPGQTYNPLFIYGGVGLGKTHLMHAIGNKILSEAPKKKIIYTSCEVFTGDFIHALQTKTINEFKKKYRTVDVLLIDDIQFLANKEGTQEEFFHTFNTLHQDNRQIVITSDRVPKEMANLEDRLTSRFGWGMIADIQSPNFETRSAILLAKAQEKGVDVPLDVLDHIATTITSNVRELEGSLTKLVTAASIENAVITKEFASRVLKDLLVNDSSTVSTKKVVQTVAKYFEIEQSDLLGKKRTKELVYPRQLVMYLLREVLNQSYPQIGEALGGKDHTTVMHGVNKLTKLMKTDQTVEQDINQLISLLK